MFTSKKDLYLLKTLPPEELAQIVEFSIRDELVQEARRILRKTNHNGKVKYVEYNNHKLNLMHNEIKEDAPRKIRKAIIKNLKEDYYQLLQYIKSAKSKRGSAFLFKSVLQAQRELKQIKDQIYNLNKQNANGFYDYMGIA